jgi:hypothetical protein
MGWHWRAIQGKIGRSGKGCIVFSIVHCALLAYIIKRNICILY